MLMLWKCCLCEFLLITKQALWWKVLQKKVENNQIVKNIIKI